MKKHCLILLLLSFLFCFNLFAEENKHIVVTCIGDSSANGNCLSGVASSPNLSPNPNLIYTGEKTYTASDGTTYSLEGNSNGEKRVDYHFYLPSNISVSEYEEGMLKSYPTLVSQTLNGLEVGAVKDFKSFYSLTDYHSMTAMALRTGDVLYSLGVPYTQSDAFWSLPMCEIKREELTKAVENGAIDNADYIIISVGSNDIFAGPLYEMTIDTSSKTLSKLKNLKQSIHTGIENFKNNLPLIIDNILQRNSDCIIILTGIYNPVYNYTLNDLLKLADKGPVFLGNILKLGNLCNKTIDKLNTKMAEIASEYSNIVYVDVIDTPLFLEKILSGDTSEIPVFVGDGDVTVTGVDANFVANSPIANGIHPTEEGHSYICRRILATLEQLKQENSISIDVADFDQVQTVKLNGKSINYTLNTKLGTILLSGNGNKTNTVKIEGLRNGEPITKTYKCTLCGPIYSSRPK